MLSPEASRAARGLLNWSLKDLAERSGVAFITISKFENGRPAFPATVEKLAAAFAAAGVEIVGADGRAGAVLVRKPDDEAG
jgi:transcriptional regulator with XRE-family HTH domain